MAGKRSTIAMSVEADKPYIKAIKALAATQGKTIGKMVREALDAQLGIDLEPFLLFFVQSGHNIDHTDSIETNNHHTLES